MNDALPTAGGEDEMRGSLASNLAALVAAGQMDADEAASMLEWLGLPVLDLA